MSVSLSIVSRKTMVGKLHKNLLKAAFFSRINLNGPLLRPLGAQLTFNMAGKEESDLFLMGDEFEIFFNIIEEDVCFQDEIQEKVE